MRLGSKLRNWWGGSLQRRLLLSNVVTTVLFLLILGLVAFSMGTANLRRQAEEGHRRLAVLVAKDINAQYGNTVETVELLRRRLEAAADSPSAQARAMIELRLASPLTYRALHLFDAACDPLVRVAGPVEELAALPIEETIAPALTQAPDDVLDVCMQTGQGGMFTSPVQIVGADRVPVLYLGAHLAAGEGQVLVVKVDLRNVWQRVDEVHAGRTGRALVVSRDGIIIAHPDRAYIGEPLPPPLRPVLDSYEGETTYTDPLGGRVMLAAYTPAGKQSGWGIVVEQEYALALAPLRTTALATFGILLVAALMATVVTVIVGRGIVRPLQTLESATQAIARTGEIDRRVAVGRWDEVGRLADAFDRMLTSLRERNRWYQALAEHAPVGIWQAGPDGNWQYVNPRLTEITGLTAEAAQGAGWLAAFHPEDRDMIADVWSAFVAGEAPYHTTYRFQHPDGSVRWVIGRASPINDVEGELFGFIGTLTDVTERVQAEEDLRASEQNFRNLVENLMDGVAIADENFRYIYVNPKFAEITGYSVGELLNMSGMDLTGPEDVARLRKRMKKRMEGEPHPDRYERVMVRKDGTEVIAEILTATTTWQGKKRPMDIVHDVTARKRTEEALKKRTEEIELLYKAGRQLSQTLDTDTIYSRFHDLVSRIMNCDFLTVSSFDPVEKLIRCVYLVSEGNQQDVSHFPPLALNPEGQGTQSVAISTGRSLLIRDYLAQLKTAEKSYYVDKDGGLVDYEQRPKDEAVTRSALIVPVKLGGQVTGVVQVMSYQLDAYSETDLNILESLASQIAAAGNNALLYQQAQHHLKELLAIYQAAQRLQRLHTPETLAQEIITVLEQTLDYEYGAIILVDEPTGQLIPFALGDQGRGPDYVEADKAHVASHGLRLGQGITGWVAQIGQSVRLGDVRQDSRYYSLRDDIRSELCVPLRVGDKILGVVNVETTQLNAYTEADQRVLETVAAQIGVALENARLYEQVQRHAGELEGRVAERTTELNRRVAEVEQLNRGMTNLLEDLQAANQHVTQTSRRLEQANSELESFTYSVSHDLRAPLRHVDGFAQLLLEQEAARLEPTSARYLQNIVAATDKMRQLIDDLLALSRTGRAEMYLRPVASNEIVEKAREELASELAGRRITWEIAPLPAVQADPGLLRVVWDNLLSNAVKYTATRPEARIEIGATPPDEESRVTFFIRDNGVGFDPRYAQKLFGAFQRLHRAEEFEGSGIGLATVRRIIHRHGGRVWAEGEPDHGATFYFTLGARQGE